MFVLLYIETIVEKDNKTAIGFKQLAVWTLNDYYYPHNPNYYCCSVDNNEHLFTLTIV